MHIKEFGLIIFAFTAMISSPASADSPEISSQINVKPDRCIALHEGQYCYQKLRFKWVTADTGRYCLYKKSTNEPLVCWDGKKLTTFRFELKSKVKEKFVIRLESSKTTLAEVEVEVAWVYKNRKKLSTGWRLF